jgi:anti-sigma B factor antagonist
VPIQLTVQGENVGDVVVLRCQGRIVSGEAARLLQSEVEALTRETKKVILQLAEVSYIDSGGLGALVRLRGVLQAARGDLKLCQLSSFVTQVLQATNLLSVFHSYASEKDAIAAFSARPQIVKETFDASSNRVVCLDPSLDLLAYLKALLKRSGYHVFTTQYPSDAVTLAAGARSSIVICGPGARAHETVMAKFHQSASKVQVLHLPADFSTSDADRAGPELVNRVRSLLAPGGE